MCYRLGLTPVHMEEFDPQRPTPEQVCRRVVQSCDVFVLLLAHRYGHRPPGNHLSFTELEYTWALERKRMPLLVFVVDPEFAWPPPDIDQGPDERALARFVAKVKSHHVVRTFAELPAFREDLIVALKQQPMLPLPGEAPGAETRDAGLHDEYQHRQNSTPFPLMRAAPPLLGARKTWLRWMIGAGHRIR